MARPDFSVLLPIYKTDIPEFVDQALASTLNQTVRPTELVIVSTPVPDILDDLIVEYREQYPDLVRIHRLQTDATLGEALRRGVEQCSHKLIARVDSDDVNDRRRFERQLDAFNTRPELDLVGTDFEEFDESLENKVAVRRQPKTPDRIAEFARFRNPVHHATVMYRRKAVLNAGNYRPINDFEDYELWSRMLIDGAKFKNLNELLVKVRVGDGFYDRRGGIGYAKKELKLQYNFLRRGFISYTQFVRNVLLRIPLRLVPKSVRKAMYVSVLRDEEPNGNTVSHETDSTSR